MSEYEEPISMVLEISLEQNYDIDDYGRIIEV